jgi:transcription antitermination protein NusB
MISRRLIRIKVLQILYAFNKSSDASLIKSEKELFFSIGKAHELYYYLLLLLVDIRLYAAEKIEANRQKLVPAYEDLHPNTRFADNRLIHQLESHEGMKHYLLENKLSWVNHPEMVKNLFLKLQASEFYTGYMEGPDGGYEADRELVIGFYSEILTSSEELFQLIEEQSIYWNDDIEFVLNMIVKSLKRFKPGSPEKIKLMDLFRNSEDRDFARDLFRKTILSHDDTHKLIHQFTTNWELERIAFMDILIMSMAINEMTHFNNIPVKVTLNEYIEIAKYYSTEKSSQFINGVLDKIIVYLKEEKKIQKTGRGLIGEI